MRKAIAINRLLEKGSGRGCSKHKVNGIAEYINGTA
jgi:hypothetical protein